MAALVLTLSGCATTGDYRLQPGDKLNVVIFGELEEQAVVRPDYKISLPIIGEVSTRGKSAESLSQELTNRYHMATVVMVQEYRTWRTQLKEALGFARDVFIIVFAVLRLSHD